MRRVRIQAVAGPVALLLTVAPAGGVAGGGCSPSTRHRILSTVFDGVPDPDSTVARVEGKTEPAPISATEEPAAPAPVVHPPFAEGKCPLCHALEGQGRFTGQANLRLPERELCVSCHEDMSAAKLVERYGWVHGPVAAGACTGCHTPHQSVHEKLLLAAATGDLCLRCHDADRLAATETHQDAGTACFDCHEPHGEADPW